MTRKVKNAKDKKTGELFYFKSHAEATYMSDGRTVENAIPTKVSQLENDKNYIENGDGYETGVYIAVQSGKLINPDEYDSTAETAIGIAVIDLKANFIISLNHTASIPWSTSASGLSTDISGLTNYSSSSTISDDLGGATNTDIITTIYSGTDCAAGLAKSKTVTYGSNSLIGYLGSAGEWLIVLNNYEAVKSAIAIAGGNGLQASSLTYWSSTEQSSTYAWYVSISTSSRLFYNNSKTGKRYVLPFYRLDNETTVLSKINLITTPAGSPTNPIYINSNGAIATSDTYAGGTAVTLNNSSKSGSTASFYAPTSAGTSGYILKSNGNGAPSWSKPSKRIVTKSGSSEVTLSDINHTIITNFTSGKVKYQPSSSLMLEYSFLFECPSNFSGLTVNPGISWINYPSFTTGKTYIVVIFNGIGIISECDTPEIPTISILLINNSPSILLAGVWYPDFSINIPYDLEYEYGIYFYLKAEVAIYDDLDNQITKASIYGPYMSGNVISSGNYLFNGPGINIPAGLSATRMKYVISIDISDLNDATNVHIENTLLTETVYFYL